MPTAPKNITIEFIAKDVNLKQTIDSISSAQQNLNKTSKTLTETLTALFLMA